MAELKRTLHLGECIFFGIGSILGAGIYAIIGKIAGHSGNLTWLSFLISSVTALLTVFSYAELSAAFPKAGGEYVYTTKAFGKNLGIITGFIVSATGIVSGATVSIGFAGYLRELINIDLIIAALGIISIMFIVNIAGIKESSITNVIFTIIEFIGLLFVIYAALPDIGSVNYLKMPEKGFNGVITGAALAFFANIGFEKIVKLAEETKQPEKNIPKALFWSGIIVPVIYCLVALFAVSAISYQQLGKSESPLADITGNRFGNTGILIISVIALFSTSNTILTSMLGSSRVLFEMAKNTWFLKRFSHVSSRRKTPIASLFLIFIVTSAFTMIGKIEVIAQIATFFVFIAFCLVNLSVIILRFTHSTTPRPYRIPINVYNIPLIPVLGILMTLTLLAYDISALLF